MEHCLADVSIQSRQRVLEKNATISVVIIQQELEAAYIKDLNVGITIYRPTYVKSLLLTA